MRVWVWAWAWGVGLGFGLGLGLGFGLGFVTWAAASTARAMMSTTLPKSNVSMPGVVLEVADVAYVGRPNHHSHCWGVVGCCVGEIEAGSVDTSQPRKGTIWNVHSARKEIRA